MFKVVNSDHRKWDEKNGYSKRIFLDPEQLKSPGNLIQEIKIKPGDTAPEHYHKVQTEIFYFLNNNGYWIINGEEQRFNISDILVIEPNDKHIVINNTKEDYLYLCFKINYKEDDSYWK